MHKSIFSAAPRVALVSILALNLAGHLTAVPAMPLVDIDIDPKSVNAESVESLIETFELIQKKKVGKVEITELFQIIGLSEDQAEQIEEASTSGSLDAQCFRDSNYRDLYCEFTAELTHPVKVIMDQIQIMYSHPTISFAHEIKMRIRLATTEEKKTGLDFCLVEGISGTFGITGGELRGALVELTEEDGHKTASGFFDIGPFGSYGSKKSRCTEDGIAYNQPVGLRSQSFVPTKGCQQTMMVTSYQEWQRGYLLCPGSLVCLNTKSTKWCEAPNGRLASTPRIQFECVVGDGSLSKDLSRAEKLIVRKNLIDQLKRKEGVDGCCNSSEGQAEENMSSATSTKLPAECLL